MRHHSIYFPPFINTPCWVAFDIANDITIGVAIPNAHGHDTTRTVANTVTANEIGSCTTSNQ